MFKKGFLESKKGVHISSNIKLPVYERYMPLNLQKNNIKFFAISFVNSHKDVKVKIAGHKLLLFLRLRQKFTKNIKNFKSIRCFAN